MAAGVQVQVEFVKRFLVPGEPVSALYICSQDCPSLPAMTEMARTGASVAIVVFGDAAAEVQAASSLPNVTVRVLPNVATPAAMPGQHNLAVIDDHQWQHDSLASLLATGAKPAVIVSRDGLEDARIRQAKYALLMQAGYYFAGLSGEHSLWTCRKQVSEPSTGLLADLPLEIRAWPVKGLGAVQLDTQLTAPGQVLRLTARAGFRISGWAMIAEDQPAAAQLFLRIRHDETGCEEYLPLQREQRTDVRDHFKKDHLLMTGFRADLSPVARRFGMHSVSLVQAGAMARYESATLFQFALEFQAYELTARVGLANRYLRGSGIEIGALQKATQLDGACQVRYIDRMPLQKLLEHYPEMASIPVQAPDIVDDGQLLAHIAEDSQDFAIANHFLEHCPDPIRSIHNMLRVVKQGGILYLAVPDKRHTFDLRRPPTPYAVLRAAYVSGHRSGVAPLFYEWAHLVYNLPPEEAKLRSAELMEEDYSIHYNVWAAGDLLNFLLSARHDFQIPFELTAVVSSENETIVLLERTAGRLPI